MTRKLNDRWWFRALCRSICRVGGSVPRPTVRRRGNSHCAPVPLPPQYRSTGCSPDNHASGPSQPSPEGFPARGLVVSWLSFASYQRNSIG